MAVLVISTIIGVFSVLKDNVHGYSRDIPGTIGQDLSVSKSSQLHVVVVRCFLYELKVYSKNSSKTMGTYPDISKSNRYFSNSTCLYVTILKIPSIVIF